MTVVDENKLIFKKEFDTISRAEQDDVFNMYININSQPSYLRWRKCTYNEHWKNRHNNRYKSKN